MRFSCDTNDLNTSLSIVSRALAVRSPKPILEGILLESCEEGLRLVCTDLALGIQTVIPASFSEEGRAVLPGKLLCEIVRKLPGGNCTISVSDRMQATIRCASIRTTISGFDPVEYPELPLVTGQAFSMPQNMLRDMIGRTLFAIAVDESRPILTGCLMEIGRNEMRMIALDGFRLAMRQEAISGPESDVSAVVGGKVLGDIAKILADTDEEVALCFSPSHVQMNMGATHIVARLLEGEFIRYRQILPQEWQTRVAVRTGELSSAIDRASLIAREGKSNLVCFKIDGDTLTVTSNSENGDMEEKIDVTTEGNDLTIAFNVRYITDVLKAISDDEVFMRFNSNVSPCVVCPTEGDGYLYLVLPVRVFNA
ncbi:MAG: DNA polymerase III subunit beta [Christensenellales bacterium]|nr:DNA polymerase III subunit beta [Christensenellales bacterium]